MAVLLIDIGNSAWKYVLLDSAQAPLQAVQRIAEAASENRLQELLRQLPASLDWVAIASVGHAQEVESLQQALAPLCAGDIRIAKVINHFDGFALSYKDVSRLGVDRWLAMLALREKLAPGKTALLADCGTAITVERLNREQHDGGLIAPGLRLMATALNQQTADLPSLDQAQAESVANWGQSTGSAIAAGIYAAALGLLERQQQLTPDAELYLTGGDAAKLATLLPDWLEDEGLVLRGLLRWAVQARPN